MVFPDTQTPDNFNLAVCIHASKDAALVLLMISPSIFLLELMGLIVQQNDWSVGNGQGDDNPHHSGKDIRLSQNQHSLGFLSSQVSTAQRHCYHTVSTAMVIIARLSISSSSSSGFSFSLSIAVTIMVVISSVSDSTIILLILIVRY